MRCIIVDDESMGRKLIEENVKQVPFLELVGTCKNAFEAIELLQNEKIDLMFSDIQMPGLMGTEMISGLKNRPLVIFITAYEEYALKGYELDVVDYLVKPVGMERFMAACNKAHNQFLLIKNLMEEKIGTINEQMSTEDFFFVNVEYAMVKISIPTIRYIEGLKDYVKIYIEGEKYPILTKITMKALEVKVAPHKFLRVHKSYIVNLRKIDSVKNQRIKIGEVEIPVSDTHNQELMDILHGTRP